MARRRWQTRDQRRAAGIVAENDTFAKEYGMGAWRDRRDQQRRERLGAWRTATSTAAPVGDVQLDLLGEAV